MSDISAAFNQALKILPTKSLPENLQPVAKDLTKAANSFSNFAKSYDAYVKAPKPSLFSPGTWRTKLNAGRKAQKDWETFKKDYQKLESNIPKGVLQAAKQVLNSPQLKKAAENAADSVIKALDKLSR